MKPPAVDYRALRLSRLNEPRFSHLKLLAGWIVYFALYFLTENLIPASRCHVVHCRLDDLIPFDERFLVFYCYWYLLIVFSLVWFLLYDIPAFKQLQVFIMITQAAAMIVYIIWPSVQLLRPETFQRRNLLTRIMGFIYSLDTPTGVCPSLHVAYSIAIAWVWCRRPASPGAWKAFMVFSAIIISVSTAFVKQHSAVDILAALPLGALGGWVLYGPFPGGPTRLQRYLERS
ncbi:MAG: phosphatidic acid phosphatase [Clostridia bacterium]|nr:phosphatidic acid phosphatase [Clostridia bacterium]